MGYNGRVSEGDEERVKDVAAIPLQKSLQHLAFSIERLDLDMVTKPQMKRFAPGTLRTLVTNALLFGVSCSLWKGSSGGPCVVIRRI